MKKKLGLLGLLIAVQAYATDDFFYEEPAADEASTVRLEESVISTTGFATSIRETPANVSIISSEEIQEKGYNTVEEALGSVPSINITSGSFGSSIDIRGQGGDKAKQNVKILVDGVSIVPLNKSHARMPLDSINMDNVQSIEVIPGGGAVLYGTGTVGGVVNIITKTGAGMTPINSVKMEAGSYGRTKVAVSAGDMIDENTLVQFNVVSEQGNSYLDERDEENLSGDVMVKHVISDNQDISLKYEKSKYEENDPGAYLTKEEYDDDRTQVGSNADDYSYRETNRDVLTTVYNNQINDNARFSMQGTYQLTRNDFGTDQGDRTTEFLDNEVREEQIDIKPKLQLKYGENNTLTLGYDYTYGSSVREIQGIGTRTQDKRDKRYTESHSVYALNTFRLNKWELTQGIRYNYTENKYKTTDRISSSRSTPQAEDDMSNMAYELAANYLYSDTGNTYIRWERGFNTPDPTSIFNNPSDEQIDEGYEYGLSGVDEETYDSFEVGIRDFLLGSYVSLTAFYTETSDEIYRDGNSANWVTYNLDKTERKGVEVSLEQYFGKLTLTEGYSYIDAEITEGKYKGNKVADVSKHNIYVSSKYEFTNKLNAIASVTYKDKVYVENDNDKGGKVNDYLTTDLIFNYKYKDNIRLYAGINNLFNEKYAGSLDYENDQVMYRAADERNYYAGVNYTF